MARDARLVLTRTAGLDVACLNEFRTEAHGHELHVQLGDLVSAQQVAVVLALRCPASSLGEGVNVQLRLSDRDQGLFAEPMPVEWRVVADDEDAAQPVNENVLVAVATRLADRARAAALEANRRGHLDGATAILQQAAADLRALGLGVAAIERLAAELEADQHGFGVAMDMMALTSAHFANYASSRSRSATGKAQRK